MSFPFRRRGRGVRRVPGAMNGLEREYAELLNVHKHCAEPSVEWWMFEGAKLRLADNTTFTPDFIVMLLNGEIECHEVKGSKRVAGKTVAYVEDDARCKIKVAAQLFPFRFYQIHKGPAGEWVREEI
jgi:hypothetical protein